MRKLASDSLVYGLGSVANQALSFLLLPLYTHYLTPADYGSLALIGAAGSILGIMAALGLHSGLIRIFFLYSDPDQRRAVVFSALVFGVAAASVTATLCLLASPWLAPLVFDFEGGETYFKTAVAIYTVAALNSISLSVLQVYQRPKPYIFCSMAGLVSSMLVTVYLVVSAGRGILGVLEGQLVGIVVQLLLGLLASLQAIRIRFDLRALREMLAFALPLIPTNFSAWVLSMADRYSLKLFSTLTEVGLYALGFRFGAIMDTLFVRPFQQAWYPYLFSSLEQPGYREMCARVLEYYMFIGGAMVLGVALFAGDVIRMIADPSYWSAESVVYWIGLGTLLRGTTSITVASIHIEQKTHYSMYVYGFATGMNLLLLRLLVPGFGMLGAAWAIVATYAVVTGAYWWIAARIHPIPYRRLKITGLVGLMTGLYVAGTFLPARTSAATLLGKTLIFAAFPLLLLVFRFFSAEDVARARRYLRSKLRLARA